MLLVALGVFFFFWLGVKTSGTGSSSEEGGFLGGFFGGRSPQEDVTPRTGGEEGSGQISLESLFLIHDKPVAGFVLFERNDSLFARFAEQESGHIYELSFVTGEKVRLTNTTIPGISEAIWSPDGQAVVFRYLEEDETIRNTIGLLPATTTGTFGRISFLEEGAYAISFSPTGTDIFYMLRSGQGSQGVVTARGGGSRRTVFTSPLSGWASSWPSDTSLYLVQRPGPGSGLAYRVNPRTGAKTELGGGRRVASLLAGPQDLIGAPLIGNSFGGVSYVDDSFGEVLLPTIPEKCAALKGSGFYCASPTSASFPLAGRVAAWYRGEFFTQDEIYRFNATGTPRLVGAEDFKGRSFDMVGLSVSPDESFLAFQNKTDGLLWGYRLRK